MSQQIPAANLAAGRMDSKLAAATGATAKALVPLRGRPMIDRILEAAAAAETISDVRVVCSAGSPLLEHVGALGVEASGPTFLDTIRTGLSALGRPERMLVITGDLGLITPAALDHFCGQALQSDASIVYPIVRKEDSERAFPGAARTYAAFRDGPITGGNVTVLGRRFIEDQGGRLAQAFAARKNPLRLCGMLGWGFVVRLALGRLTLEEAAERVRHILAVPAVLVQSPYAEIGFDVDKPSHLAAAEAWLAAHEGPGAV